jgi:hypothetical protein
LLAIITSVSARTADTSAAVSGFWFANSLNDFTTEEKRKKANEFWKEEKKKERGRTPSQRMLFFFKLSQFFLIERKVSTRHWGREKKIQSTKTTWKKNKEEKEKKIRNLNVELQKWSQLVAFVFQC